MKELRETDKKHTEDIVFLREGLSESRLFQKMITDQLAEIKIILNSMRRDSKSIISPSPNKEWLDFVKWVLTVTIVALITWILKGYI